MSTALAKYCLYFSLKDSKRVENLKEVAKSLGAKISDQLNSSVSLVIYEGGEEKDLQHSKKLGITVVGPSWLQRCKESGKYFSFEHFALEIDDQSNDNNNDLVPSDETNSQELAEGDIVFAEGDKTIEVPPEIQNNETSKSKESSQKGSQTKKNVKESSQNKEEPPESNKKTTKSSQSKEETPSKSKKPTKENTAKSKTEKDVSKKQTKETKENTKSKKAEPKGDQEKQTKGKKKPAESDKMEIDTPSKKTMKQDDTKTKKRKASELESNNTEPKPKKAKTEKKQVKEDDSKKSFHVVCSGCDSAFSKKLRSLGIFEQSSFQSSTSHVIVGSNGRTKKVLQALSLKIPIVKKEWINASKEAGQILNFKKYLASDWFPGVDYSDEPLFEKKIFYISSNTDVPDFTKEDLVELVSNRGGEVHGTDSGADIVIAGRRKSFFHGPIVSATWIFDALSSGDLPNLKSPKYLPTWKEEKPRDPSKPTKQKKRVKITEPPKERDNKNKKEVNATEA